MSKMTRDDRRKFYQSALEDQRHLLETSIGGMQKVDLLQALHVATGIRVLVHETSRSKPLLKELSSSYLDLQIPTEEPSRQGRGTAILFRPIAAKISTDELPLTLADNIDLSKHSTLGKWWNRASLLLPDIGSMKRREIILGMADREAAHADHEMEANYEKLIKSKFLSFRINDMDLGFANIARLATGKMGLQMLRYLELNFPKST